tara:strand:- start:251 stop:895 length:645 start_codon:yes stop_codon:yes gene_type:complete
MNKTLAFINPNSTETMTTSCAKSLQSNLLETFKVRAITNRKGPPAIQGAKDGEAALDGLLDEIGRNLDCDGFVIGCFDDTGIVEARKLTTKPVIGIGQASFHLAVLSHSHFKVLTTLAVSIPVIQKNIEQHGFENFCTEILASGLPVLELERNHDRSIEILSQKISRIETKTNQQALILGCAGMTNIIGNLQSKHKITLIDPIMAAARLAPALF